MAHTKNGFLNDRLRNIIMETKGGRRSGRPRIRWLMDVCNDLKAKDGRN
jgi:hypothetical protein